MTEMSLPSQLTKIKDLFFSKLSEQVSRNTRNISVPAQHEPVRHFIFWYKTVAALNFVEL